VAQKGQEAQHAHGGLADAADVPREIARRWAGARSFVAKPLNGIQLGCLSGGIIAKENSDAGGEQAADGKHLWRQLGGKFEEVLDDSGRKDAC
jgi:hypothetical protein